MKITTLFPSLKSKQRVNDAFLTHRRKITQEILENVHINYYITPIQISAQLKAK